MARNSNIEILRVIAMLMIIVGHLFKFLNVVYTRYIKKTINLIKI